jgi:hypothetical protein
MFKFGLFKKLSRFSFASKAVKEKTNKTIINKNKEKEQSKSEIVSLDFKEKQVNLPNTSNKENFHINPLNKEYENYAAVYFKYYLQKDFDLFSLRNLLYSYIFTRQRKGKILLNISDTAFQVI